MMRIIQFLFCSLFIVSASGQTISKQLETAIKNLEADVQMKNATLGFYVVDQKTSSVIFNKNGQTGMVPASSQKIITAATILEMLGNDYRFQTDLSYDGKIEKGILNGNIYLMGYGDPTLGSERYDSASVNYLFKLWISQIKQAGIKQINGQVICFDKIWESQTLPGGWIWDDIGNYYGAGSSAINWRENNYDIVLKSGKNEGDSTRIVSILPTLKDVVLINEIVTGKPLSGDNAWIYLPPYCAHGFLRGTIPPGQNSFKISGSFPNPTLQLQNELTDEIIRNGITLNNNTTTTENTVVPILNNLISHYSASMENMVYWFLRKSINLYGEAFVKTIGFRKKNRGATTVGIEVIKDFWKTKGIDQSAMNMGDGSGLSPLNRITPEVLVNVMQYAKSRPWYSSFYKALPEFNGIKMKSGTMTGVKSFTGYINGFTFAIIINNYSGPSSEITRKIYKVLDVMK